LRETIDSLVLLGWLEEAEALRFLRDECVFSRPLSLAGARSLWHTYRRRTEAAAASRLGAPAEPRPVTTTHAKRFLELARGCLNASAVVAVDPAKLLAFQFSLSTGRSAEHAAARATWAERCLLTERPRCALPVTRTANSIFFDIPHAEHALTLTPEGELRIEQFPAFSMIVPVGGGFMLRAGYHRAYAYLNARPTPQEPFLAAVTEGNLTELRDPQLRAKLTSSHPPLVGDFLNANLAMPVKALKYRFRFKVSVELKRVPVGESD